jgi:hypothetical protein
MPAEKLRFVGLIASCALDEGLDLGPPHLPVLPVDDLLNEPFELILSKELLVLLFFDVLSVLKLAELHS